MDLRDLYKGVKKECNMSPLRVDLKALYVQFEK